MDKVIDGVDVSGCEFSCENPLHEIKHSCNVRGYEKDNGLHIHLKCKNNPNCYYKQLKRLERQYEDVLKLAKENADSNEYCLQELEQENEQLKEEMCSNCDFQKQYFVETKNLLDENKKLRNKICKERAETREDFEKIKQALQEIREIVNKAYYTEDYMLGQRFTELVDAINLTITNIIGAEE